MKKLLIIFLLASITPDCKPTKQAEVSSITLQWNGAAESILGFVIEKKEGNGQWLIVAQAEANEKFRWTKMLLLRQLCTACVLSATTFFLNTPM